MHNKKASPKEKGEEQHANKKTGPKGKTKGPDQRAEAKEHQRAGPEVKSKWQDQRAGPEGKLKGSAKWHELSARPKGAPKVQDQKARAEGAKGQGHMGRRESKVRGRGKMAEWQGRSQTRTKNKRRPQGKAKVQDHMETKEQDLECNLENKCWATVAYLRTCSKLLPAPTNSGRRTDGGMD